MKKAIILSIMTMSFIFVSAQIADHKISELKKIITLTPQQESELRKLYKDYAQRNDSIYNYEKDPIAAADKKQNVSKVCHIGLMNILTDEQKVKYIRVTKSPEVMAKTDSKIVQLTESGQYTSTQIDSMRVLIFNYLMLEKVVYTRDKYDIVKQKTNIERIKLLKPVCLKESETREKLNAQGKIKRGKVTW